MKLEIDFDNKILTVEQNVNFGEFMSKIKKHIPDWKDWTLNTKTHINWGYYPVYPQWPYSITIDGTIPCMGNGILTNNITGTTANEGCYTNAIGTHQTELN